MVAKGEDGKPTQVPELILENMTEMRRFADTIKRMEVKKEADAKIKKEEDEFIPVDDMELLADHRCKIEFKLDDDFNDLFSDT